MSQTIQQNQNKKKNKQGSPWGILVILLIFALRALRNGNFDMGAVPVIVGVCVVAAAAVAIIKGAENKKKNGDRPSPAPARKTPSVELHRPVPSMQRREPVIAPRQFPQPEAYCVSCELSGEDHFVRDRKRRLEQLNEWLKNGLIDREEYRVLKYRFERDQ